MQHTLFKLHYLVCITLLLLLLGGCGSTANEPGNLAMYSANFSTLQSMPIEELNPAQKTWKKDALLNASDQRHHQLVTMLINRGLKTRTYDLVAAVCDVPLRQKLSELSPFWDGSVNKSKKQRSPLKTLNALLAKPVSRDILDSLAINTIGSTDKYGPYTSQYSFTATPLGYAARWGSLSEVKSLLDSGASVTTNDISALHIAAYYHRFDVAKLLIDRGADVNATTSFKWCDLSQRRFTEAFSGIGDEIEGMRFCLEKGATPLMFAAATLSMDTAQLLVNSGADLSLADQSNKTVDNYSGKFARIQQRAQRIDRQRRNKAQEDSFSWGKIATIIAGNAYASSQLDSTQFARFSQAFTADVLAGTTSNTTSLTNQLKQEQVSASVSTSGLTGSESSSTAINEQYQFTCPSGDTYTETIQAKSQQCASAMKTYLKAAGCNLVDEMQQAEKKYYSACASEMY